MDTNLVIVESPGKVESISKYLNSSKELKTFGKFIVTACFGHIYELKKPGLGIDIENDFKPTYALIEEKKEIINDLIKKSQNVNNIYLASDKDGEGEFISYSIKDVLKLKNYKRIVFTEITQRALENAIKNPGLIDEKLLASQQCRRILDRLVGFKLSPLLWKKFSSGNITLSAGRVQSCLMHFIIQKENDIEKFTTNSYWHIDGDFNLEIEKEKINLKEVKLYEESTIYKETDKNNIEYILKNIKNKWNINNILTKITKQNPDAPFITSSLQQEASSKLKLGIKKIMQLAQNLYEKGVITYMRTDSFNMSEDFKILAYNYIEKTYGPEYVGVGSSKKKIKGSQQAHECIRITDINVLNLDNSFTKEHKELYKLIWQRTVTYLMKNALFDELEIKFNDKSFINSMNFITTFKKVKFNGFLIIYNINNESNNFDKLLNLINNNKYDLSCIELRAKETYLNPPPRYNDSSLVKVMEKHGIGRPSSYSSIIEKLYSKNYIIKSNIKGIEKNTLDYIYNLSDNAIKKIKNKVEIGAEQSKVVPTDIGKQIDNYLETNFEYITNKDFTSNIENSLDEIQKGNKTCLEILNIFWSRFSKDLNKQNIIKTKKQIIKTENKEFIINNVNYNVRIAKFGPVIQYELNNKTKYIPLKGYLYLYKKEYLDINEDDINFLVTLPKIIGEYNGKNIILEIGPYGIYLIYNKKNIKIPNFALKQFIDTKTFTNEQLKNFIDYSESHKLKKKKI